jgi:exonuclease SbcC
MIFKTLHIQNFQSHVDTVINFQNGLNIIVGPSDAGKSAIIRALRKLIRDDPAGKDFINHRATECTITLTFEKNNIDYTIIRKITTSKNLYYLNDHEFGGFGREIPQEIQNVLEMFLIDLENCDQIDLHFVDQHDAPFMVAKGSAGTRSKLLGRIGGLHILDRAISSVNRDTRTINAQLKEKAATKDEVQQKISMFPDLTGAESILKRLTDNLEELQNQQQLIDTLEREYALLNSVITQGKQAKARISTLPTIQVDFEAIRAQSRQFQELENLQNRLIDIDTRISQLISTIPKEISINLDCIINQQVQIQELENLEKIYIELISKITATEKEQLSRGQELQQLQQEWITTLRELKICPTCKQSTEHVKIC